AERDRLLVERQRQQFAVAPQRRRPGGEVRGGDGAADGGQVVAHPERPALVNGVDGVGRQPHAVEGAFQVGAGSLPEAPPDREPMSPAANLRPRKLLANVPAARENSRRGRTPPIPTLFHRSAAMSHPSRRDFLGQSAVAVGAIAAASLPAAAEEKRKLTT